ncbi:hypothetical protein H072_11498 [Dactylellina haptotyla CBS 200.50]|uniref:Vacuolar calcium ion transporter n=1 Tax=Dactylellina haptotyla (strain CBS 200.50) TaxID=1284197 RepID=S8A264_DACHA|nr:hypothetical protein H072_11498 [Dactylellina haptotyla CBS 200.50]
MSKDREDVETGSVTPPEKAWRRSTVGDISPTQTEFPREQYEEEHHHNGFWRVGSKQHKAHENHAQKIAEGIPPPFRFNPIKIVMITGRHTSKLSSLTHILLPAIPAGLILWYHARRTNPLPVFIFNFIAIIPAGNLLSFGSGELQHRLPKTIGATLEIFTGAIVEIIVCVILLHLKQYDVVRAALLGSMFANLLLVTGACFLAGGIAYREQKIASYVGDISSAALLVSAVGMVSPSLFFQTIHPRIDISESGADLKVLYVSRVVSIGLIVAYFCFLFFQLHTHSTGYHHVLERAESIYVGRKQYREKLSVLEAIFVALLGLVFVCFCAYFLVREIEFVVEDQGFPELFMGLILVPLVEKFGEHLTALNQAWDNQLDLALSHCLGGSIQTALFVAPLIVLVGWGLGHEMDLNFELFIALSLLLAILVVGNFVRDGKTNWLKGMFLLMVYYVIAVAAYNDPELRRHYFGEGLVGEGGEGGIKPGE